MRFTALLWATSLALLALAQSKLLNYSEVFAGGWTPARTGVLWVSAENDGVYLEADPSTDNLILKNIVTGESSTFVDASNLGFDYYASFTQPSQEHVMFAANYTKQYRHSYFADYYVYNRRTGAVAPLVVDQKGDVQYAVWSLVGDTIAFVRGNDLYIWNNGTVTRVTHDGGPDVFNGVPDWVYEEEIFADRFTLWFSPDGEYIAFLRMNETDVPTYTVPYYMAGGTIAPPYPRELELRYPKVSEPNPTVTFQLLHVSSNSVRQISAETFAPEDLIIGEVAWVADANEHVIFRCFNRVQDHEKLVLVDVATGTAKVVRERDGSDGWLDNNLAIQYVGKVAGGNTSYYLDVSDHTGWAHLYLYPVQGGEPTPLTSGQWEVTSVEKIDVARGLVYYTSTERHSTERHLYSVSLSNGKKVALVDTTQPGYWDASFSFSGGYYILSYNGPSLPWQRLYSINSSVPLQTLNGNAVLRQKLSAYTLPTTHYHDLKHPDGYILNAREILPANFDPLKKYPVLFDPYGGPGSQQVSKAYSPIAWRHYIASDPELEYIIVTVDPRGTGYQGRAFRSLVTGKLGTMDVEDQIWAAKLWAAKAYVDKEHIAMWGWSYGGYLTAKVIEKDSGVFSLGLITAPVSDWRFYDSMYTERYMKTLAANPAGYSRAAVRNATGFSHVAGGVLVQHGTGDDNVHFQNSAVLVDTLVAQGVSPRKLSVMWFTDQDHSIAGAGAARFVYKQLTERLWAEKERGAARVAHQWDRRRRMRKGVRTG